MKQVTSPSQWRDWPCHGLCGVSIDLWYSREYELAWFALETRTPTERALDASGYNTRLLPTMSSRPAGAMRMEV